MVCGSRFEPALVSVHPIKKRPWNYSPQCGRPSSVVNQQAEVYLNNILLALGIGKVSICLTGKVSPAERRNSATALFEKTIFPVLTPLSVDLGHPFPFISNLSTSLGLTLPDPQTGEIIICAS